MASPAFRYALATLRYDLAEEEFAEPIGPLTPAEFDALVEASGRAHEFVDGFAYAMAPVRRGHNRITLNVAARLLALTRGGPCETYVDGFQVRPPDGRVWCPDAMVACGPVPPDEQLHIADPCLLVEVLSRGTARADHGQKRESYQRIPSLGAYLIVETAWRAVHRHWRDADGAWRIELVTGADAAVALPCPAGGVLTLAEIYEGTHPPDEPPFRASLRRVKEGEPAAACTAG